MSLHSRSSKSAPCTRQLRLTPKREGSIPSAQTKNRASKLLPRDGTTLPMQAEQVERREFNDVRHGTQVVTANLDLATGQLLTPTIGQTRTEADFVEHIAQLIQTDPKADFIIVCDQR